MINKRTMAIAYKLLGAFEISGLTLENDSGLKLLSDTSLTVVENANIAGIINAEGGDFLATTDAEFVGDRVRLSASDGSQMAIAAPTYSSSGLNFTTPIMSADGVGTILDLSTITSLDTSFNDGSGITSSHEITATQGGLVDLSGVVTISPPERREDYLQLILQDADSTIDLSSLETISGFGGGTIFGLSNEASLTLPSVEILEDVQFVLVDGATFSLGTSPVTYSSIGLNFGSFALMVADGMETELDLSAMTCLDASFDDGTGFINTHEISATNGGQIDLSGLETLTTPDRSEDSIDFILTGEMSADGVGTELDLSAMTSLDTSFDDGTGFTNIHTIRVTNGGKIDLSGVEIINPPTRGEDLIELTLSDDQSTIDLSGLQTISGTGGRTLINLSNGATLDLTSLTTAEDVIFDLTGGATFTANGVQPLSYSSAGINSTEILMSVDGIGTELDLSAMTSLDASFDDGTGLTNTHSIRATNGGQIDLSGLETLTTPNRSEDSIDFMVSGEMSAIDLSALMTIDDVGGARFEMDNPMASLNLATLQTTISRRTQFDLSNGATVTLPSLETANNMVFNLSEAATLSANGTQPVAYSSSGISFSETIMSADGVGTELDLSAMTSLDTSFDDGTGFTNIHTIRASNGGKIDLSGVSLQLKKCYP